MSDETLNTLKLRAKGYERYLKCNYHHYNLEEEIAHEVITRFNEYEQENQQLKEELDEVRDNVDYYSNVYWEKCEVLDEIREYINKMFDTGFYNDDYYLGHLKMILKDKDVK